MARLTVTNTLLSHKRIIEQDKQAGFKRPKTLVLGRVYLAAHMSRRQPVSNVLQLPSGDFCACAGTLLYRGEMGETALRAILQEFDGNIDGIRDCTMGCYLLAVGKDGEMHLFVDKYETFHAYYRKSESGWLLANSLKAVASCGFGVSINELALVEATCSAIIGSDTIFSEVHRLLGSEHVVVDTRSGSFHITQIPYNRRQWTWAGRSVGAAAKEFSHILREKTDVLLRVFGNDIAVNTTGGVDNRMVLAGFLASGVRPTLLYGIGNSPLTNTRAQDLTIVRQFASRFRLPLHVMDWSNDNEDFTGYWDDAFARYGFLGTTYGANKNMFQGYEQIPSNPRLIEFGYFGETLRNRPWIERYAHSAFTLDQFLDSFYVPTNRLSAFKTAYGRYGEMIQGIKCKLLRNADYQHISRQNLSFSTDHFTQLYAAWFRAAHGEMANLLNLTTSTASVLSSSEIHEFSFDIPRDFKLGEEFVIRVTGNLTPELLNVPFYSHLKLRTLDTRKHRLSGDGPLLTALDRISPSFRLLPPSVSRACAPAYQLLAHLLGRPIDSRQRSLQQTASVLRHRVAVFANEQQQVAGIDICDARTLNLDFVRLFRFALLLYYANSIRHALESDGTCDS